MQQAKCINNDGASDLKVGQVYYIKDCNIEGSIKVGMGRDWKYVKANRFVLVDEEKPMKDWRCFAEEPKRHNAHEGWRDYEFNVRSLDQIDNKVIEEDLSWTNPMMILETEGSNMVRVYLHDSIWNKAECSGPMEPWPKEFAGRSWISDEHVYSDQLDKYLTSYSSLGFDRFGWVHRRFLPGLIALVKEIKTAEWENPKRAKCTVRKIQI